MSLQVPNELLQLTTFYIKKQAEVSTCFYLFLP